MQTRLGKMHIIGYLGKLASNSLLSLTKLQFEAEPFLAWYEYEPHKQERE
jgi:hypothetical protein